jgi:hypothetical protein
MEDYEDGLLMDFQKQDGVLRCHSSHPLRRDLVSLLRQSRFQCYSCTPVRNEAAKIFTSTHDNFVETTGIRHGVSHYTKILSGFYDNLDTSDPNDPGVNQD